MEKNAIINASRKMTCRDDLLELLNRIKKDKMVQLGCVDKYHPFTQKHIKYYCNPNNNIHRYISFKIKKKTGGYRQISSPRNRSFKFLLRCLNELLNAIYVPSGAAMGFVEGRSVIDNASKHMHMNYVLNLDLKDFFPSIEQARLWKRLQIKPFNFPTEVASVVAGLCCMKGEEYIDANGVKKRHYTLPQGAPTSPIVTNMICDKLDHRLMGVAKRFGLNYSRYADDITFSSMHNVYQRNGDFIKEVYRIIADQGFIINEKKTRLQKVGSRQEVTGITVNEKLNVTQKYTKDLRNILFIWRKYGYNVAYNSFFSKYVSEKGYVKKGIPNIVRVVKGKLEYLKLVKGDKDSVYTRLNEQFKRLIINISDPNKITQRGTIYLETASLHDFEKIYSTEISIVEKDSQITTNQNGNITQHASHRYALFDMGGRKLFASVNKNLTADEVRQKDKLAISSCLAKNGASFWLIHKTDKVTVPPPPKVDIDELINYLDALLT